MKKQILELFKEMTFEFESRIGNIIQYKSTIPIIMDGNYCDIYIDFFDNNEDFLNFETINDLINHFKVFEIIKKPIIKNEFEEVLFSQKNNENF